jgi:hypothetical protein
MSIGPVRALMILATLLTTVIGWLWIEPGGGIQAKAWIAPLPIKPDIKLPKDIRNGGKESYDAILERPLFAPDRRPPPLPAPPPPPPPPDPLAGLQIQGVFTGDRSGVLARVNGKFRRIFLEDAVGPWVLKTIKDREVTFVHGGESRLFQLSYAPLQAAVAKPAAVPPVATPSGGAPTAVQGNSTQSTQDETRERLRRRNEIRAARGLPMVAE